MPIATDPIGAIRKELIGAARRRAAVRRRRRRRLAVVATGASMLFVVGGVSAVADLGTGVPAIDQVLSIERNDAEPVGGTSNLLIGPPGTDVRPTAGSASEPVPIPATMPGHDAVGVAYTSVRGEVCFAEADVDGDWPRDARGSVRGCWSADVLARRIEDRTAVVASAEFGDVTVLTGFADPAVQELEVRGPGGPLDVELTRVWTPNKHRAEPLRLFVAVDREGADTEGRRGEDSAATMDFRSYELVAELEDGQTVSVGL